MGEVVDGELGVLLAGWDAIGAGAEGSVADLGVGVLDGLGRSERGRDGYSGESSQDGERLDHHHFWRCWLEAKVRVRVRRLGARGQRPSASPRHYFTSLCSHDVSFDKVIEVGSQLCDTR